MTKISKQRFLSLQSQASEYAYRYASDLAPEIAKRYVIPALRKYEKALGGSRMAAVDYDAVDEGIARQMKKDGEFRVDRMLELKKAFAVRNGLAAIPEGILIELERGYEKGISLGLISGANETIAGMRED